VTVTGGAGAGANTTVTVYQTRPDTFPERRGRAAGRTQERIVRDTIHGLVAPRPRGTPIPLQAGTVAQYGLMAPRPRGTPIPLQTGATTQRVGLRGIGNYHETAPRGLSGLMGLGADADDQDPIEVGAMAQASPILSTASLLASTIMLRMAAVPRARRLNEMVSILNAGQPGLGESARSDFFRREATMGPRKKDQAMFDAIRAALADTLVDRTLKLAHGTSGLGQTLAEARGQTSQGVNDANAVFCSYVAGTVGMVGGFVDQLASGGTQNTGAITGSSQKAGATAGCGAGQLIIQGQNATAMARLSQSGVAQTMAMSPRCQPCSTSWRSGLARPAW
jgi:hypothetical protein